MRTVFYISLLAVSICLPGCGKKNLSPKEYMKWYGNEENGQWNKKQVGNYELALLYRSPEYIFLLEKDGKFAKEEFEKRKKDYGNMQYYLLRVNGKSENELMGENISEEQEYYLRLEYFTGPMQNDISLVENGDTLPCLLFHYERNYGISPNNNFLLGFEKGSDSLFYSADKTVIFDDRALGMGPVSLSIKAKDLKEIPTLNP